MLACLPTLVLLALCRAGPAAASTTPRATATATATANGHAATVNSPLRTHVRFGAYVDGMVADPTRLTAYEAETGRPVKVASYFYGFGDEFPASTELAFASDGNRDVLLSWDMGPTRFTDWSAGKYDGYLRTIAAHAAAYPYPVYVRPWPEMNGDWQDFQPTAAGTTRYGGTPAQFIAAWRHVVTVVRAAGGGTIRWVFNPTTDTYAGTTDVRTIWPGSGYVDVLGLDGYNWGNGGQFQWREFADIFLAQYARLTALHPTAPVWVCEYGSKEPAIDDGAPADPAHSKAAWIQNMLASTAFPRIGTLVSFDIRKERDWRGNSSIDALAVLRGALKPAARGAVGPSRTR